MVMVKCELLLGNRQCISLPPPPVGLLGFSLVGLAKEKAVFRLEMLPVLLAPAITAGADVVVALKNVLRLSKSEKRF